MECDNYFTIKRYVVALVLKSEFYIVLGSREYLIVWATSPYSSPVDVISLCFEYLRELSEMCLGVGSHSGIIDPRIDGTQNVSSYTFSG